MHRHLAAFARDDAHDVGSAIAQRHEIREIDYALFGFERRFKYERVTAIPPADARRRLAWADQPTSMVARTEQRRETGVGVEARPAQPVHGAAARYQHRGFAVANQ